MSLLSGESIPYTIRISARARVLHLVIRQESGLEIVVPRGTRKGQIEEALRQKAAWIQKTLRRLEAPPPLEEGRELAFLGQTLKLHLSATAGPPRVTLVDATLTVSARESDWNSQEILRTVLEGWFRRRARELIPARLTIANKTFGFTYGRVAVKEQRSRWGSCSKAGNLNFNWRLLLAPLPVLDYVLIHELAHLKELNHAPAFWQLVASVCPDYKTHRRWLREHGHTLRL